ncbi:putative MFS-type transporter [Yarrowia sp. C11]|nr:putative MFS-type transporter [Yarrowia sp. C11]
MDTIFLDPEYIPGTVQIIGQHDDDSMLIKDEKGTVLLPQPTSSPNDPLKWSWSRKMWHTLLVCFITGFTAATSNDSGAASDGLLEELGVGYDVQNTAAGVLFLGIGYWCLLISPLGSLYGRRLPYLLGCILGLIGAIWFGRIKNVGDLICSQLFVGASEAVAEAYSQVSLIDIFHDHQSGSAIGIYVFATSIGTFLGPLIAGYIQIGQSWRWVGWWALIIGGGMTLCFWFGFEESYFPRNLVIASERGQTGLDDVNAPVQPEGGKEKEKDPSLPSRPSSGEGSLYQIRNAIHPAETTESTNVQTNPKVIGWRDTQRSFRQRIQIITPAPNLKGWGIKQYFQRLWTTMKVFCYPAVIYSGLQWGAQDAWLSFYLTTQEDTYGEEPYNYSPTRIAVMKVPLIIGASIGCFYGGYLSDKFVHWCASRPSRNGVREAEDRLWMMLLNCIISPLGMYLFGIGTGEMWSWPIVYVGLGFIGFGWGCAGDMSMSYLVDAYPEMVLEGMVGVSVINNSMGSIFTFVCDMWFEAQGITDTYITTGSVCAGILFLTIPMIIFGKYFRRKTTKQYLRFLRERDSLDE